jgi:hypothetical protein
VIRILLVVIAVLGGALAFVSAKNWFDVDRCARDIQTHGSYGACPARIRDAAKAWSDAQLQKKVDVQTDVTTAISKNNQAEQVHRARLDRDIAKIQEAGRAQDRQCASSPAVVELRRQLCSLQGDCPDGAGTAVQTARH